MATAAKFPGDADKDSDVLISRRGISGGASQIFVTAPAATRKIQAFDIACVGSRLLAIAWLEHTGDTSRARLLLTDFDAVTPTALGGASLSGVVVPSATNSLHNLGPAGPKDGIAVAAIGDRVLVSWSSGEKRSLQIKRFDIGSGSDSTIHPRPTERIASRDAVLPKLVARGKKVVLAYSDDGKLKVRTSRDSGSSFSTATTLLNAGTVQVPSKASSASLSGSRIVIDALKKLPNSEDRTHAAVLIQSTNFGGDWTQSSEFGNRGPRMAALRKVNNSVSRILEAWHDDGASVDVLRAQREVAEAASRSLPTTAWRPAPRGSAGCGRCVAWRTGDSAPGAAPRLLDARPRRGPRARGPSRRRGCGPSRAPTNPRSSDRRGA